MRIKIKFSKNTTEVPVNNQSLMNSYIHKCLGRNNIYHDSKNNYSISHLYGGKLNIESKTLNFDKGGFITISSLDSEFINKLLIGIVSNPDLFHGMKFSGVDHINENFNTGWNYLSTLSPFIIKIYQDKKTYKYLTLDDVNFETEVKNYLIKKISTINPFLDLSDFDVKIPPSEKNKIKKSLVKNVLNISNHCHINIHTNKKVMELLYNIGLGQSTGSGFGTIFKTENHKQYNP